MRLQVRGGHHKEGAGQRSQPRQSLPGGRLPQPQHASRRSQPAIGLFGGMQHRLACSFSVHVGTDGMSVTARPRRVTFGGPSWREAYSMLSRKCSWSLDIDVWAPCMTARSVGPASIVTIRTAEGGLFTQPTVGAGRRRHAVTCAAVISCGGFRVREHSRHANKLARPVRKH